MIALSTTPTARAAIDDAIDTVIARLARRLHGHGDGARALASAIARSAEGGKRFRPLLVVAAFDTLRGRESDRTAVYQVAAAFELLHTAFVVHDDVIDHDTERRGVANVGGEFRARGRQRGADDVGAALLGDAAGILAGDLLLHEAGRLVALADLPSGVRGELLRLVEDAVLISAAGELADVENAVSADEVDADTILRTTHDKTAVYSFSAPLEAGAVLAGADRPVRAALERFGQRLGLAYQLVDDLIGAFGSSEVSGKDEGCDLREAKKTHLIVLARETESWPEVNEALSQAHTGPVAIRAAQRALSASGARARLEGLVRETLDEARAIVTASTLPDECRDMLHDLVDAVQGRVP
ncbi:polyprenyl synthetase family protein [Microbacterium sp. 5K110]|jgi:geranylgeranyl diphosphate synthase type II|uniref:polyprenyl synthetase family protein n=1 Tax=unclassified Microbacterium TaxID=2609290 RepID=UPI0010FF10EC|nr:polyprenyl synthetase family protein [Microbacterium sp. 5K110]TLF33448.1 polyprenyl synthetase family protein [Microbacterium sp. 5K110]